VVETAGSHLERREVGGSPALKVRTRAAGTVPPLGRLEFGPHLPTRVELRLELEVDVVRVDDAAMSGGGEFGRYDEILAREHRIRGARFGDRHDVVGPALGLLVPLCVEPISPDVVERARKLSLGRDMAECSIEGARFAVEFVGLGMPSDLVQGTGKGVATGQSALRSAQH